MMGLSRLLAARVLHDEGHARKGLRARVYPFRLFAGPVEAPMDHGVQGWVELLDAFDGGAHELARRQLARTGELGLGGRVERCEVHAP
jgi:hypothetical protein